MIELLGLDLTSPRQLSGMISVSPVRDTQLINVSVQDTDPVRAALIANALVAEFVKQNQEMQAARYQASKQNLENQLTQLDTQIQQASDQLTALDKSDQAERDRLEPLIAQYRQTYASLLQSYEAIRLAEAQSTSGIVQIEPAVPPLGPISRASCRIRCWQPWSV